MSASMASQDVTPSRPTRALQKVTDIVRSRTDGVTGLVVYSGEAHTVTPLTDDTRTIETLLPALSPFIMPAPGSRPEKARSEEHTSELQSRPHLVCRLLLEKK